MGFALVELLVIVIVISILGIAGVLGFGTQSSQVATPSAKNPQVERVGNISDTVTLEPRENIIKDKIVFTRLNGNIILYDINTQKEIQLTSYNGVMDAMYNQSGTTDVTYPQSFVFSPTLINTQEVGFGKCDVFDNGTKDKNGVRLYSECGIFKIDLKTKKVSKVLVLKKGVGLNNVVWFDDQTYAYITTTPNWKLFYVNGNTEVKLQEEEYKAYGDEYGVYSNLSFSRNGSYLLQASPSFPRSDKDFKVYAYDLSTYKETIVENAIMAEWLDKDTFVFNKYPTSTEGLWRYDMITGESTQLPETIENDHQPIPRRGQNVFMYDHYDSGTGGLRVYDGENGKLSKFSFGCSYYGWVNPETIICKGLNESPIFNVTSGEQKGSIYAFDFNNFVTEYNGSYAKYETFIYPLGIGTF